MTPELQELLAAALSSKYITDEEIEKLLFNAFTAEARQTIYSKVPYANPQVVEALLLMQVSFMSRWADESIKYKDPKEEAVATRASTVVGNSIKHTIEKLYGVKF